jgi:signal transduction histidine kinase
VSQDDKDRFDELKPSDSTQAEFFSEIMATYEHADETITLDTERLTDRIKESVASEVELAAYRGVQESLENAQ